MLDSLYEKALKKRDNIHQKLEGIEYSQVDASQQWIDYPLAESGLDVNIGAGDGRINNPKFLHSYFTPLMPKE